MNGYDGPSMTAEGEQSRQLAGVQHSRSSAWSNMRFERAVIKSFSKDGNLGTIEMDDGQIYESVRIQTPLSMILFLYGEVEKLFDIPGLIIYRSIPQDGFVLIGDIAPESEETGSRIINEPFYL